MPPGRCPFSDAPLSASRAEARLSALAVQPEAGVRRDLEEKRLGEREEDAP